MESNSISMSFNKKSNNQKINILFEGWINIGHSYAIVNCFQLIHLWKNYKDSINFYISEQEYYRPEWKSKTQLVYTPEYNELLTNTTIFKPFHEDSDTQIDLIYRITYPYNIKLKEWNRTIPICVFYTSEFSKLDPNYFTVGLPPNISTLDDSYIKSYLTYFKNISFTSPSKWSAIGMYPYINETQESTRNKIISHGVDTSLFFKDYSNRDSIRRFYGVSKNDILLMNIGAMTRNKGILLILEILNILVNKLQKTHFKLLLKGSEDLYQTKLFLESYCDELQEKSIISKEQMTNLLSNHIIFTDKTLSFTQLRSLYNAADLYLSPYLAEGFNLCCLEALTCGLNILVPTTGSTQQYIQDIYQNSGDKFIYYINSNVIQTDTGLSVNHFDGNTVLSVVLNFEKQHFSQPALDTSQHYLKMIKYIEHNYSWNSISHQLFTHFNQLILSPQHIS